MGILAQGILIGDGAVATYLDLFSNKELGMGLFKETTDKSYRRKNFDKNNIRMSSYYNILRKTKGTDSKRYLSGNLVSAYNVDGIPIGYAYTTDINDNTLSRGYASSADFDELQRLLREKSLDELQYGDERNFTIKKYSDIESFSAAISGITPTERGEFYEERLENYRRNHDVLDSTKEGNKNYDLRESLFNRKLNEYSENRNYLEKYPHLDVEINPFWGYEYVHDINANVLQHYSINEIAEKLRPKEQIINEAVLKYGNSYGKNALVYSHYGDKVDFYERLKNSNNDVNRKSFLIGLSELSDYYSSFKDNLIGKASTNFYKFSKSYGVLLDTGDKGRIVNISNTITSGDTYNEKIITDNGGTLKKYNHNNLVTTYNFFDESDGDDNIVPELSELETLNMSQGSSISIKSVTNSDNFSRLLKKTNELFRQNKIKSLVNRFHTDYLDKIGESELITAKTRFGLSRGRNLLKSEESIQNSSSTNGYENPYCRVWTAHYQYSKMKDRIRPFVNDDDVPMSLSDLHKNIGDGLRPNNAAERFEKYSVLQSNGFLKITPSCDRKDDEIKNYMFSIENLAWKDFNGALSKEQKGPNDGRIMWFPPYNLKFTENISVNWNDNNFIGRGEKIYTYTNTERSGTLSFSLLIDHPSILNTWRGTDGDYTGEELKQKEDVMLRFFAGCEPLSDKEVTSNEEKEEPVKNEVNTTPKFETKKKRIAYIIFFPNNHTGYDKKSNFDIALNEVYNYEMDSLGTKSWNDNFNPDEKFKNKTIADKNLSKFSLNSGGYNQSEIKKILLGSDDEYIDLRYLDDIVNISYDDKGNIKANYVINNEDKGDSLFSELKVNADVSNIEVYGFASSHGYQNYNVQLSKRRADFIKDLIKKKCTFLDVNVPFLESVTNIIKVNDIDGLKDINTLEAKVARSAMVIFNINKKVDSIPVNETVNESSVNGFVKDKIETKNVNVNEIIQSANSVDVNQYTYDNEYLYFKEISKDDYFVKNIVNRIRHFDPAFHSITPEGFNARLTFLHQCTRQGPTTAVNGGDVNNKSIDYLKYAGNLSFGRAPYCILRIGDFFNTKILIDSISIDYDNGGGTQWDLNPEGAGVQPMMANVNLNFKFIGGQDISGPVERLQNAVTSNYYANASIYDKMADYKDVDGVEIRNLITRNKPM